jgi:hypothetical protein
MKMKNLLQTMRLVAMLCVFTQLVNAQCTGDKVLMSKGVNDCCGSKHRCQSKCIDSSQVQSHLNHGWYYGNCQINLSCCCCEKLDANEFTTISYDYDLSISPNPVSNSTTISFYLPESQKVTIKIFDVNGRLMETVADKYFDEEENEIVWNATDMKAGIYFLTMQTNDFIKSEKLIVTNK